MNATDECLCILTNKVVKNVNNYDTFALEPDIRKLICRGGSMCNTSDNIDKTNTDLHIVAAQVVGNEVNRSIVK